MIDFKVWDVVPRTEMKQTRPISTTYVFKAKPNADGSLERLKARVCARGFLQRYGTDLGRRLHRQLQQPSVLERHAGKDLR